MPSFDSGYYAFTALIPLLSADVQPDPPPWRWQARRSSVAHSLRDLLGSLRTVDVAEADHLARESSGEAHLIPFSASDRTHFARLVVVEQLAWNGREQSDTLLELLRGALGWSDHQSVDRLPCPYLLVLLDFDAPDGSRASVENYFIELWSSMEQEWTLILRHCRGFDPTPQRRLQSFLELMLRYEIDSTFTYTGYGWAARQARLWDPATGRFGSPGAAPRPRALQGLIVWLALVLMVLLGPALVALVNQLASWLGWLLQPLAGGSGASPQPLLSGLAGMLPAPLLALAPMSGLPLPRANLSHWLLLLAGLALLLPWLWSRFYAEVFGPWPAQPDSDLRSVLKALYLQGRFLELVERRQRGATAGSPSLRRQFREFLEETQPRDRDVPSLKPGSIQAIRRRPRP